MKRLVVILTTFWGACILAQAEMSADDLMPIRGYCIAAPHPAEVDRFLKFVDDELVPRHVNTLVLRVDYNYQFESRPELRDEDPLSKADVKKMVQNCRTNGIKIIPQINFLGHQSYRGHIGTLLLKHPELDETPWIKLPQAYNEKQPDALYCKSYCPLHPEVHDVIFAVMDELCEVFEADAYHAGMDEVFLLGEDKCKRCSGHDKAELFANEVRRIHDHLEEHKRRMWMWGDRFIEGKATGVGKWEGSYNGTWRAIDMVPKDIMICDWHYVNPVPTAAYFAVKGFDVVTCPWKNGKCAMLQADDMARWRVTATKPMRGHFQGMMQTVWSGTKAFLDNDYAARSKSTNSWNCFTELYDEIAALEKVPPVTVKP